MMKKILISAMLLFACALSLAAQEESAVAKRCERGTMKFQGKEREFYVYKPEGLQDGAPLVIALHGYGGSALKGKPGLMDQADRSGFAVCYPQGTIDSRGKAFWQVGYPVDKDQKVDDIAFVKALVRELQRRYGFSRRNVFLTGMSNGGEMCYLMAKRSPRTFSAIASVAGLTLLDMGLGYRGQVPFMEIHGTADKTSLWTGDVLNEGGWGAYMSVPAAVSYIVAANECKSEAVDTLELRRNRVIRYSFRDGKPAWEGGPATEVWLYKVEGGKHTWAEADMDTFGEIWKFFSKYLRD